MTSERAIIATGCGAAIIYLAFWLTFVCGLVWLLAHIIASAF